MAEMELFQDVGEKVKKTVKNKPFLIAAVGVGAVALYLGWKKTRAAANDTTAYNAVGYGGYPTVGGAEGSGFSEMDYVNEALQAIFDQMNKDKADTDGQISDLNDRHDEDINDIIGQLPTDRLPDDPEGFIPNTGGTISPPTIDYVNGANSYRDSVLAQMKANSSAWHLVTDQATKDALVAENQRLGASIGLTFNPDSGLWFEGGSVAYVTPTQEQAFVDSKTVGSANYANEWVPNVDYQARINSAIMNGSDATTINTLNTQRNAKIADTGYKPISYDMNTDYQALINRAEKIGASQEVIDNLKEIRAAKLRGMASAELPPKKPANPKVTTVTI